MSIKLELKPEIEARLIAQANAQGISVETYLEALIEDRLTSQEEMVVDETVPDENWEAELMDLINSPTFDLAPPLTDAAVNRESIYTREDNMI